MSSLLDPNLFFGRGIGDITLERQHQFDLGYDIKHDLEHHSPEELMRAGACYIDFAAADMEGVAQDKPHTFWPEDSDIPWVDEDSALEYAVKGAAFVAAAIDLINVQAMGGIEDGTE